MGLFILGALLIWGGSALLQYPPVKRWLEEPSVFCLTCKKRTRGMTECRHCGERENVRVFNR